MPAARSTAMNTCRKSRIYQAKPMMLRRRQGGNRKTIFDLCLGGLFSVCTKFLMVRCAGR